MTAIAKPHAPELSRAELRQRDLESGLAKCAVGQALTVREAAAVLDCSAQTIREKCKQVRKPLEHFRAGNEIRIWPKTIGR